MIRRREPRYKFVDKKAFTCYKWKNDKQLANWQVNPIYTQLQWYEKPQYQNISYVTEDQDIHHEYWQNRMLVWCNTASAIGISDK